MVTNKLHFNLVKTGASSWSAVLVQNGQPVAPAHPSNSPKAPATSAKPAAQGGLFAGAKSASRDWTKTFSRIAIAVVTLMIARRG
jgi:hypothetical protein